MTVIKTPWFEIMLFNQHAKRVRCNRKTFHEFEFTLLDDKDKLIEFGKGKTQINMTLRPMPVSRFPHEFTLIVPFNETLQLKSKFDFDGSREVEVMQVALPTTFINVKDAEMNFTMLEVSNLANPKAWHYRIPQGVYSNKSNQGLPVTRTDKIQAHARFNTLFMYAPGLVKETMVGDVMAPFFGNVTPVFER